MFHRFLICLLMWHLTGVFGEELEFVMEGDSVTLHSFLAHIERYDEIEWWFVKGFNSRIAKIYRAANNMSIYADVLDERFKDRLGVSDSGYLTITNITTHHTGLYQMIITIGDYIEEKYRFYITVYGHLPIPVIMSYCPENPPPSETSSVSKCVVFCSVLNVRDVSLSWYKGNSLLSSISESTPRPFNTFLSLEVEYQDTNTYSCVVNNAITNQTQHLNINDVCQMCSDSVNFCATTEAVIRLVVSALVGVAAVVASVVLIYDIRSRRAEQKRRS